MSPTNRRMIDELRMKLISKAEKADLDLQDPEVLELSQELDELIVMSMQEK